MWSAFVIALLVSIVLHELGHYLGARWGGMKVTEFFIGFGPRIWSIRRGETEYGLKAIPLGAYVKSPGMSNLEEIPPEDEARTYRAQSYGRRVRMVFAGPAMNLLIALVLFIGFFAFHDERIISDPPLAGHRRAGRRVAGRHRRAPGRATGSCGIERRRRLQLRHVPHDGARPARQDRPARRSSAAASRWSCRSRWPTATRAPVSGASASSASRRPSTSRT